MFNRKHAVESLMDGKIWDVIIIGGGATGLGIAVDAASRGYATLLLEQSDFAKGTSSRSTKLVHGGVRYLAQGDIRLVYDALRERGLLLKNAAHIVRKQAFIIPCYSFFSKFKYLAGLKLYDALSGAFSFGKSRFLKAKQVADELPYVKREGLTGGIRYFDGQFDDSRLAINLAQTAVEQNGVVLNYFKVTGLLKNGERVNGVQATDLESKVTYQLRGKTVINATGVFVDDILKMDTPDKKPLVRPSQGVHVVLDKSFLKSDSAVMIPETADGRVLFAVPWHDHVLLGTTDTPLDKHALEPVALTHEIRFILNTFRQYMTKVPTEKDVLSVFAGLRPLAAPDKNTNSTKEISRDHKLIVDHSGLITITGGKWTTYRKMAEETVDKAIVVGQLNAVRCNTRNIAVHGCMQPAPSGHFAVYGSDWEGIQQLTRQQPELSALLSNNLPYTEAEVIWSVRNEMARTVEDVLARRLRMLFLNAREALRAAPRVAALMAEELNYGIDWQQQQVAQFNKVAQQYVLKPGQADEQTNHFANLADNVLN